MINDAETLLQEATEALKSKEYAKAEALQSQGCKLLREEPVAAKLARRNLMKSLLGGIFDGDVSQKPIVRNPVETGLDQFLCVRDTPT